MELDKLYNADCIEGMGKLKEGSVDLAFADPPFNIGYKYDVYKDRLAADEYLAWTRQWGAALVRTLKPNGTAWLAIGDDFAAELKITFRDLGLVCRSWVIWYYTFGVNCKYKFSRSHTHLFHFVKDPKNFTFNKDAVLVPSARQLVYGDSRAAEKGRLPDDTWIIKGSLPENTWVLRPQDAEGSFRSEEDVWYFPRVCGTFVERAGWHGCQMPEQLLGRIIKVSSNVDDTVLDPFGGSGTTLVVAKKLKRRFIGFELSKNYAAQITQRLNAANPGGPLSGADQPLVSAPPTTTESRARAGARATGAKRGQSSASHASRGNAGEMDGGIIEAFLAKRQGFPVDRVIADPEINAQFVATCAQLGLAGKAVDWNQRLMHLRKTSRFKGLPSVSRTTLELDEKSFYRYKFACEIALQRFEEECNASLDHILCDPSMAAEFDKYVLSMIPDQPTSLMIRWFALRIRKAAKAISVKSAELDSLVPKAEDSGSPFTVDFAKVPASPGLYWVYSDKHLYVGETDNLQERLETQFGHGKFDFNVPRNELKIAFSKVDAPIPTLPKQQSRWITKWNPIWNFKKLAAIE